MDGVRSIFRRKGYLLTALAAAVLLAASSGTARAQGRVTIGPDPTSGSISEQAYLHGNSQEPPQKITITVEGLSSGSRRPGDVNKSLGDVTITPDRDVYIARVTSSGYKNGTLEEDTGHAMSHGTVLLQRKANRSILSKEHFHYSDVVEIAVAQSENGVGDNNFSDETVELRLDVEEDADAVDAVTDQASVAPGPLHAQGFGNSPDARGEISAAQFHAVGTKCTGCAGGHRFGGQCSYPRGGSGSRTGSVNVRVSNRHLVVVHDGDGIPE